MPYAMTMMEILYAHGGRLDRMYRVIQVIVVLARLESDTNVFSNILTMNNNVKIKNLYDLVNNWVYQGEDF